MIIHANLDAEARWAGGSLPGAIAARVSYYAALTAALAPADAERILVYAPAAIDPARIRDPRVVMHVGTPPRADLVWARSDAKAANDRRRAITLGHELGVALPGASIVESSAQFAAWASAQQAWVAKVPWTSAGRDRCHGNGAPSVEQATRIARLVERHGALIVEPWCNRVLDVGVCATVGTYHGSDEFFVSVSDPHGIVVDARGTFIGIDLEPPALLPDERTQLGVTARAVGAHLAAIGHRGAFAIDAFVHTVAGERRLHPLCEINARYTFGHVARALGRSLHFTTPPPDATLYITPANDGIVAWS